MMTMLSSSKPHQLDRMFKPFYAEKFSNGATITTTIEEYYDVLHCHRESLLFYDLSELSSP